MNKDEIVVELPQYFDGGLFIWNPKTGKAKQRFKDDFYINRNIPIASIMKKWVTENV